MHTELRVSTLVLFISYMIDDVLRFLIYCRLQSSLGSGQFGEVYKATWSIDEQELELAVKTLKAGASEEDKVKFLLGCSIRH